MAKKSTKKPATRADMRQINLRLPPPLAEWLDDTASATGMSRDGFIRQILVSVRATWKAAKLESSDESLFMRRMESRLLEATERAVQQAAVDVIRTSSGLPPLTRKGQTL